MEANILNSRSHLSRKTRWTKHPPSPHSHPRLVAKPFSSRGLSSINLSRYLSPSHLHHHNGDDDNNSGGHRLYSHGGTTASIPFAWESQPSTRNVRFCDHAVPPLTPPPSYCCKPAQATNNSKLRPKPKFLISILPKLRSLSPPSPMYSSSSPVTPSPAVGDVLGRPPPDCHCLQEQENMKRRSLRIMFRL